MFRKMLKAKLHRATVTEANLEYEGSLTVDSNLLAEADILEFEEIHVWNVTRGTRLTTYAMNGDPGTGEVCVNGAGAHLVHPGDLVIVASFVAVEELMAAKHKPRILLLDERNRVKQCV